MLANNKNSIPTNLRVFLQEVLIKLKNGRESWGKQCALVSMLGSCDVSRKFIERNTSYYNKNKRQRKKYCDL